MKTDTAKVRISIMELPVPGVAGLTGLLKAYGAGDAGVLDEIFTLVLPELRARARGIMRGERPGHTLPPTALVNEAFLRLFDGTPANWENSGAFIAAASREMRRAVIDHARRANAAKRRWREAQPLAEAEGEAAAPLLEDLLDLDRALNALAQVDPVAVRVVEMRYFTGLESAEAAAALGVTTRTVERRWAWARAWLHDYLTRGT